MSEKFDPKRDLETSVDDRGLVRRIVCKVCVQVLADIPPGSTETKRLLECKGVAVHLEISHDMIAFYGPCRDPQCGRYHMSAFSKDELTPEQLEEVKEYYNVQ